MAKSDVGRAAGKAVKRAAAEGAISLTENLLKEKEPKTALKRSLESSTKEIAKSVKKIAKAELKKERKNAANASNTKVKKKGRKKVVTSNRKSIFD